MLKLYYSPGACSLSPHITALEAGIDIALEKVDMRAKKTETGRDFLAVNPKGYVPVLELENGESLTEGPAIVQYLADQKPASGLAPAAGTLDRYRLQETLGFINSEIHKQYSPLFYPTTPAEYKDDRHAYLKKRYATIDKQLAGKAYLFTVTNWAKVVKLDLGDFQNLGAFQKRVAERPAVRAAMEKEGLPKA
jgi:glutathione S-transferase